MTERIKLAENTIIYGIDGEYEALELQHLNDDLCEQILVDQEKAEILTKMYQAAHNVTHYGVPYIGAEGTVKGTITTITVLNKQHYEQLLEKEKKFDKFSKQCIITVNDNETKIEPIINKELEQENKNLNQRIETISDDLGNKLQVKELELELLQEKIVEANKWICRDINAAKINQNSLLVDVLQCHYKKLKAILGDSS